MFTLHLHYVTLHQAGVLPVREGDGVVLYLRRVDVDRVDDEGTEEQHDAEQHRQRNQRRFFLCKQKNKN